MDTVTGREPELSGARDEADKSGLREAWVLFELNEEDGKWVRLCLGVFERERAIENLMAFANWRWPGKCHWDGYQVVHENSRGYNRGFLWDPAVSKR